ncbi:hypothetical protein NBRC116591_08870 [Sessilibacter corallicola]|uniref:Uncharacterized protein n=1 Tax=Sessilibacter corallicola TaxID=2904075 RepID=A0ABQ0A5Z6_9GAMM
MYPNKYTLGISTFITSNIEGSANANSFLLMRAINSERYIEIENCY